MNLIVIMSDTLRRDHLGCYGNKNIRTPNLDQFAEECVQFDNCHIASFPTMPMRADLFTGKFTFTYLKWEPLPRGEKILAQILGKAGYTTLATVDIPFFTRNGYGYDRGFEDYSWIPGQYRFISPSSERGERPRINYQRRYEEDYCAPRTMAAAEKYLEYYYKKKFFLYVDTWDPHEPWDPPSWYVEPYYPGYDGRVVGPCYWNWREKGLKEEDIKIAHACYCGEITMVDRWVGRLLDRVKSIGLWENTVIVFTSDHGFYFGEHNFFGKLRQQNNQAYQSPLYQEITRVPLLIYVPGIKPKKVKAMVSLVDIMPTLLELAEVKTPETVQGKSLVSLLEEEKDTFRDFVVSSPPLYNAGESSKIVDDWTRTVKKPHFSTIATPKWTFLYSTENSPAQLYDIENDPKESQNVLDKNWQVAKDLHQKFVRFLEGLGTDEHYLASRRELHKE